MIKHIKRVQSFFIFPLNFPVFIDSSPAVDSREFFIFKIHPFTSFSRHSLPNSYPSRIVLHLALVLWITLPEYQSQLVFHREDREKWQTFRFHTSLEGKDLKRLLENGFTQKGLRWRILQDNFLANIPPLIAQLQLVIVWRVSVSSTFYQTLLPTSILIAFMG